MDKLLLDTRIYGVNYIMDAIEAYSGLTEIEVEFNLESNKSTLTFKCSKDKLGLFKAEFCNYLIAVIATAV